MSSKEPIISDFVLNAAVNNKEEPWVERGVEGTTSTPRILPNFDGPFKKLS
jgi:hypothetical protein